MHSGQMQFSAELLAIIGVIAVLVLGSCACCGSVHSVVVALIYGS